MNKQGILLINLGSPDSPSVADVRTYLREFLMDERVIDVPYLARFAIVHGAVLPFRPKKSAEAYRAIWRADGSPLIQISKNLQKRMQGATGILVELAMRYRNPSVELALQNLVDHGVDDVLVVPLFPHYAKSSYESAVERVREVAAQSAPHVNLRVLAPYFEEPPYINALMKSAEPYLARDFDHLLFSFHGVPERHLRKTDPTGCHCLSVSGCCEKASDAHATCYRRQCIRTAEAFAATAGLPEPRWSWSFQSRLGSDEWLKPYTHEELARLAGAGVRKLIVMCPAFAVDCLETLEEIGMRGRETFLQAGGTEFALVPCLNDQPAWVQALSNMSTSALSENGPDHAAFDAKSRSVGSRR